FGDIHDIGKNIVRMLLENHGFEIIDLGKDVHPDKILEAATKERPDVIALSALLTTTMVEMGTTQQRLKDAGLNIPVIIGGAVVTDDYADSIGASRGSDAAEAVKLAKLIVQKGGKR
ncbi:MAG: cobalamin-dependent protein, partial [Candidatus Margulisbacteria bacterium]|nr:cobalamin-dependent protein [Candidatus Margulisiibacteriota bacterium]